MTRKRNSALWKKSQRLLVIGYGHWGKALAQCFSDAGYHIESWSSSNKAAEWPDRFREPTLVLLACPFEYVRHYIQKVSREPRCSGVINASKGIDRTSLKTFSQMAKSTLKVPFASLSGPSFAEELSERKPTACILAGHDAKFVNYISERLSNDYFRIYAHSDPVGVEVCGATKNILAIACGISHGLGFGENARAALLTRALPELIKICRALGGKPATVFGLAGVGDLWLTASGEKSRNRRLGYLLGKGFSLEKALFEIGETVEGIYTLKQIEKLRRKHKLDLPICAGVYQTVVRGKSPESLLRELMNRALKPEESSVWKLR